MLLLFYLSLLVFLSVQINLSRSHILTSVLYANQPIIAIQNPLPPEQIAHGFSLTVFGQTFGGSFFLTFANIIFSNSLLSGLRMYAPTVDGQAVIAAGVTDFRQVVAPESLLGVLQAYSSGVITLSTWL